MTPWTRVHGILQARILEWVAVPFSGYFPNSRIEPTFPTLILCRLSHQGSPRILEWVANPFSSVSSAPGIKPGFPALQADSLPTELSGKPDQQTCPVITSKPKCPSNCSLRDTWADSTFTGGPQTPGQARRSLSLDTDAGDCVDTPAPYGHGVWGPRSVLEAWV